MTALITGNLLNIEQQSHDTAAAWSAKNSLLADGVTTAANTTLSRDTVVFHDSPASIKLVAVADGTVSATTGWRKVSPVPAGAVLRFQTRRRRAKLGQNLSVLVNWIDSAGTLISQTNLGPTKSTLTTADTVDTFVEVTSADFTSPSIAGGAVADTATAEIVVTYAGLIAGEAVYFDTSLFARSATNQPPTANAGPDQAVTTGSVVTLSGSGSDPEGTALTYSWAALTRPTGSAAVLSSTTVAAPTFTADVAGTYSTSLTVTDAGGAASTADPVQVTATTVALAAPRVGANPVKLKAGAARLTKIYRGSTLVFSDSAATSQAVVQHSDSGTGGYQWEYSGTDWKLGAEDRYTSTTGATATLRFTGNRFVLFGTLAPEGGFMSVAVDGGAATTLDLYATTRQENRRLHSATLANGAHTVVLTCVGDRNVASSGFVVNIDRAAVDVVGPPPAVGGSTGGGTSGGVTGTRNSNINLHPFRGSWTSGAAAGTWSIWNTPIGSGAQLISAGLRKSTDNSGKIYQDKIHIGYPGDPIKTYSAAKKADGTYYEGREPWKSGHTEQVRVTADDTGPGSYTGGNHLSWFPLSTDYTKGWHGHPLGLTAGGNPTVRYVDPHDKPDDLHGQGHRGAHGGSHMSGLGCIRQWEWDSPDEDVIQHAIGLNIDGAQYLHWDGSTTGRKGKRWPANSTDSYAATGYKGTNPSMVMGTLLTLPANYNWSAITNLQARKVVRAMWAFGFYIVDDAKWDVHQLSAERTISLSAQDFAAFHTPIQDAMVAAVIVDNNSPTSVGGGGTPRVPLVPDPGIALASWYPGGAKPDGSLLDLQRAARRSYDKFMNYCLATDGMPAGMPAGAYRIKAPNQGFHPTFTLNATVSEGIGYGMLLTAWMSNPNLPSDVRVNARAIFDGLWTYYKHFRDANGLMNWHINPDGTVAATGGASDGDFDVAMALVIAHRIWGSAGPTKYGADATALINIIRDFEFTPTTYTGVGGPNVMMNGDLWGVDTDRYMPDYFRPGWFRQFHKHTGDARWLDIIAKNYPIALGHFWTNFTGGVVPDGCTRASLSNGFEAYTTGYNAVRWFGIAADHLYHPTAANVLAHDMSHRMISKAKTHWPLGGDVKAPVYDLNLAGPFETFYNSAGGGMFGMASLVDAAHTKYAAEIAAKIDADTELSYFNRGQAAITAMFMAGIAQV